MLRETFRTPLETFPALVETFPALLETAYQRSCYLAAEKLLQRSCCREGDLPHSELVVQKVQIVYHEVIGGMLQAIPGLKGRPNIQVCAVACITRVVPSAVACLDRLRKSKNKKLDAQSFFFSNFFADAGG